MKRNKFLVFLIFVIFTISFSIETQAKEAYHFEVSMEMIGNDEPSPDIYVTCNFKVYRNGAVIAQIPVVLEYNNDGTYFFDSDFTYQANDTFTYTIYSLDSTKEIVFFKTGGGDSDDHYVEGRGWWTPMNEQ